MHFCKNSHNRTLKLLQENKSMQRCHSDTLSNYYGRKSYNSWSALNHFNQAIQFLSLLVPHSRNVCFAILIPCGDNRWEFSEAESWVMWIYPFAPFLSQTHKWKINHMIALQCRSHQPFNKTKKIHSTSRSNSRRDESLVLNSTCFYVSSGIDFL